MKINFTYSGPYDRMLTSMSGMVYEEKQSDEVKEYIGRLNNFLDRKNLLNNLAKEIENTSGLKFKSNNLNCFVVKNMKYNAFSHPFTVKFDEHFENLKAVLVHELIHILFVDNGDRISKILNTYYQYEDLDFKIHYPVLLVQKKVLENLFGEEYFKRILRDEEDVEGLKKLWSRVEKADFDKDIVKFLENVS